MLEFRIASEMTFKCCNSTEWKYLFLLLLFDLVLQIYRMYYSAKKRTFLSISRKLYTSLSSIETLKSTWLLKVWFGCRCIMYSNIILIFKWFCCCFCYWCYYSRLIHKVNHNISSILLNVICIKTQNIKKQNRFSQVNSKL